VSSGLDSAQVDPKVPGLRSNCAGIVKGITFEGIPEVDRSLFAGTADMDDSWGAPREAARFDIASSGNGPARAFYVPGRSIGRPVLNIVSCHSDRILVGFYTYKAKMTVLEYDRFANLVHRWQVSVPLKLGEFPELSELSIRGDKMRIGMVQNPKRKILEATVGPR